MLQTYKAILHGDKIEWKDEIPEISQKAKTVNVEITILEDATEEKELRPFGLCAGDFVVPEDFDTALPEEVLLEFECK